MTCTPGSKLPVNMQTADHFPVLILQPYQVYAVGNCSGQVYLV